MDSQDNQDNEFQDLLRKLNEYHALPGSQTPSDPKCAKCDDSGWIWHVDVEGYRAVEKCSCLVAKEADRRIRNSGLSHVLDNWTLDTFSAAEPWQARMKETAEKYIADVKNGAVPWMYIGGAVGSGKSHVATAVCGELLRWKMHVRYFQWLTDARRLKSYANDAEVYDDLIVKFQNVPMLYIDDLYKSKHGKDNALPMPTDADVRVAFEIIDGRYKSGKPLIITSEWYLEELMDADEAVFSRVYEKSKGYKAEIKRGNGRNYRTVDK